MTREDVIKMIEDEFNRLRDLKDKYENTPNGYKYWHKMASVRDLMNSVKRKVEYEDKVHPQFHPPT